MPTRWVLASWTNFCLLAGSIAMADGPGPAGVRGDEGAVEVVGTVKMPDGKPAVGAVVETTDGWSGGRVETRTDGAGRFVMRGMFADGVRLQARSGDGARQATRFLPQVGLSLASRSPVELTLAPALEKEVTVVAGGKPVEGARVAAVGKNATTLGVTGSGGKVRLLLPADDPPDEWVAWHPTRGIGSSRRDLVRGDAEAAAELALLPPEPLKVRVVDEAGRAVPGLDLGIFLVGNGYVWARPRLLDEALARTDAEGTATLAWAPREGLTQVEAEPRGGDWKRDEMDLSRLGERVVTLHVRRKVAIHGSIAMPEGAKAEGLLVMGSGCDGGEFRDVAYARARADGTFTIRVCWDHMYGLAVTDLRWAGPIWTGVILPREGEQPAEVVLPIRPAAPLYVAVARGVDRTPVRGAYVEVGPARGK